MYYSRAVKACPTHTNNLGSSRDCWTRTTPALTRVAGNYALFLADIRQKYDKAEQLYQQAIASDPHHANSLYNYAVLLDSVRHDYDRVSRAARRIAVR